MRRFPPGIPEIGAYLDAEAGSYLRNIIREPQITCRVCALPVDGWDVCLMCRRNAASEIPLADRVGSLIYAIEYDSQAYRMVSGYKSGRPGRGNADTMRALLALGLRGHAICAMTLSGVQDVRWAVVPSTRRRPTLRGLVRDLARHPADEIVIDSAEDHAGRELRVDRWLMPEMPEVPDHVLLIDDSWVSGAHAQSLAGKLKLAGVAYVSILTVARVLRPSWDPVGEFIRDRLSEPFDWRRCPWTGEECPES